MKYITGFYLSPLVHIVAALYLYVSLSITIRWLKRKWPLWWDLLLPSFLILGYVGAFEGINMLEGGYPLKSLLDICEWAVGCVLATWFWKRFAKRD